MGAVSDSGSVDAGSAAAAAAKAVGSSVAFGGVFGCALFFDFIPGEVVPGLLARDPVEADAWGVARPVRGGTLGERWDGERVAGAGDGMIFSPVVAVTTGGGTGTPVDAELPAAASAAVVEASAADAADAAGADFAPDITAEEEGARFNTGDLRR
jgi:hypothetical protein